MEKDRRRMIRQKLLRFNENFLPQVCTNFHRVFARLLLPTFRDALSIRYRLIGKKNFTSQFRDGSKDKTELALPELI